MKKQFPQSLEHLELLLKQYNKCTQDKEGACSYKERLALNHILLEWGYRQSWHKSNYDTAPVDEQAEKWFLEFYDPWLKQEVPAPIQADAEDLPEDWVALVAKLRETLGVQATNVWHQLQLLGTTRTESDLERDYRASAIVWHSLLYLDRRSFRSADKERILSQRYKNQPMMLFFAVGADFVGKHLEARAVELYRRMRLHYGDEFKHSVFAPLIEFAPDQVFSHMAHLLNDETLRGLGEKDKEFLNNHRAVVLPLLRYLLLMKFFIKENGRQPALPSDVSRYLANDPVFPQDLIEALIRLN